MRAILEGRVSRAEGRLGEGGPGRKSAGLGAVWGEGVSGAPRYSWDWEALRRNLKERSLGLRGVLWGHRGPG